MFFRYLLHQWQKKEPCRETFICQGATFSGKTPTMLKCLMVGRSYKVTMLGLRRCLYSSKRPPEDNCLTITRLIFYFLTFFLNCVDLELHFPQRPFSVFYGTVLRLCTRSFSICTLQMKVIYTIYNILKSFGFIYLLELFVVIQCFLFTFFSEELWFTFDKYSQP